MDTDPTRDPIPDPITALAGLEGVPSAVAGARDAIDVVLRDRGVRRLPAATAAEALLRSAWASAALDGSPATLEEARAGTTEPIAQGALRLSTELLSLGSTLTRSPGQALARMHTLAAARVGAGGTGGAAELGRPRRSGDSEPADPLELGTAPGAEEAAERLAGVLDLLGDPADRPAVVVAAVVHAELALARPFVVGNGVVARAAARLVLQVRGVDPPSVAVPEEVQWRRRTTYRRALRGYATGTPAGVAGWLRHCAEALGEGAAVAVDSDAGR